jgi:isopenicillin N synthase-like dioxygenase
MTLPLIDLQAEPAPALARRIDAALREHGFFAVRGHGVPADTVSAAFEVSRCFFTRPQAVKELWHINGWPLKRGFDPIGWQALDPSQPPDVKESFYVGVEAIGPNQWPYESMLPGFRRSLEGYASAMEALARRLMSLFELALDVPRGHFDSFMRHPTCTTRLLHYPPRPAAVRPGQIGCGAHTDWGALTLLAQDDAGGLQVQTRDGDWQGVEPIEGAFIVNVGDLTARWTNDRWRSTMHRVVHAQAERERWSIAYFFDLDAESVIEPLPQCIGSGERPHYGPITAGEHLTEMYRRTTVAA